jgi:arylsulfatase A-like enzyme
MKSLKGLSWAPRRGGMNWAAIGAALVLGFSAASCVMAAEGPAPPAKPNFLVIVADDMGFSDAGCYGGEIATPNLDNLAANGLRFTQTYSTARCWPSRTCILTGYYAQQVRMDPPQGKIPPWARVLPHYLKPLGYRAYHSGKWHLMGAPRPVQDGGFDHSYCLEDPNRYFAPKSATLDDKPLPPVPDGTSFYVTTAIANHAIDFLKEHAEKHGKDPFLLYLAFTSPHFPLQALPEDIARYRNRYLKGWDAVREDRYRRMREKGIVDCELSPRDPVTVPNWNLSQAELAKKIGPGEAGRAVAWKDLSTEQQRFQAEKMAIHAAMIDRMDREIGRVLGQLQSMGVSENTVVFFVSDNGASAEQIVRGDGHDPNAPLGSAKTFLCLGPGWSTAANTPLRLHKSWVHEGGIASPMIVHWPAGLRAAGQLRHTPGHFIDLLPTLVELAGGGEPGPWNGKTPPPLPGRSLVPALAQDAVIARDYLYWHHMNNRAIRVGDWKLVSAGSGRGDGPWELYDVKSDRAETKNHAAENPAKVKELADLWQTREDQFRREAGPAEPAKTSLEGRAKPNIILILTDDQGYGDLSCHGNPILRTPNLDRLHDEGRRFVDFHVSTTCSPTRCSLMTGRHEFRSGVTHTIMERERMSLKATTIAQVLKSAGYTTGIFGKWHLGDEPDHWPDKRGFDEMFIHGAGGIGQTYAGSCGDAPGNRYFDPAILHNGKFEKTRGYCTDVFFGQAMAWIESQKGKQPFFAYITPNAPHAPLDCPAEYEKLYAGKVPADTAKFFGMIANIDDNVGRLLAKLKEWDIERDTLVIFMNDNGGTAGVKVFNAGMRGGKVTPYEGGTRGASFWRWPGTLPPGDVKGLTAHLDVFPTLAALARAQVPAEVAAKLDGRSLVPLLENPGAAWADRFLFTHVGRWERGQAAESKYQQCSVRNTRFQLVSAARGGVKKWELYDLRTDPGEKTDLAAKRPNVVRKMEAAYDAWWAEVLPALENEDAVGPKVNPFKELYWKQFGGGPGKPR